MLLKYNDKNTVCNQNTQLNYIFKLKMSVRVCLNTLNNF